MIGCEETSWDGYILSYETSEMDMIKCQLLPQPLPEGMDIREGCD